MKKILALGTLTVLFHAVLATPVQAVCPVCAIAVGAGVGFSRYLGVDDLITGLWVGGLLVSLIMWTLEWLAKKNRHFSGMEWWMSLAYFALVVAPLYWLNIIGTHKHLLWMMDRLLVGITLGSLVFFGGAALYQYLKKKNNGHAHFPFEKVVMPVAPLLILSAIFYFATK
jgi:hypothetical protein